MNIKRVIVVTGTPGVGKSTVAGELASRIKANLVSIGDLVRREKLYVGTDRKRGTLVADARRLSDRVKKEFQCSDSDTVVEGHYAVDLVPPENVHLIFVLRRDPKELRKVLQSRGYSEQKARENLAAEILDVCLCDAIKCCGASKTCEVDVSGKKRKDVVNEMLRILEGKSDCHIGLVDWLGKLELTGELDEYLKDF